LHKSSQVDLQLDNKMDDKALRGILHPVFGEITAPGKHLCTLTE